MKALVIWLSLLVYSWAYAGTASLPPDANDQLNGIVTPNVATGVFRTNRFTVDVNGNMVYCHPSYDYSWSRATCVDSQNRNAWVLLTHAVPRGKTYVGFKSVHSAGAQYLEIYWK